MSFFISLQKKAHLTEQKTPIQIVDVTIASVQKGKTAASAKAIQNADYPYSKYYSHPAAISVSTCLSKLFLYTFHFFFYPFP